MNLALEVILAIAAAVLTPLLALLINKVKARVLSSLDEKTRADAEYWVNAAVLAAEQTLKGSSGADRKQAVLSFLKKYGLNLEKAELDVLIESAVYAMNNMKKE